MTKKNDTTGLSNYIQSPTGNTVPNVGSGGPFNPDGTPNFNYGSSTPVNPNDPTNIWFAQLPTMLQKVPELFYNINPASKGHQETGPNAPVDFGGSGDISELNSQIAPGTTTKTVGAHPSSPHYISPADILNQIAGMQYNKPQDLMAIQAYMANGAWGPVNVNGVFDKHTQDALINAMERYYTTTKGTGAAMSFMDYLKTAGTRAAIAQQQQKAASSGPQQVRLADPAAIASAAQNAAQGALGKSLTKDQLDQFVLQFQAEQRAYETSTDPTVTAPQLGTDAMSFVQSTNPGAYQGHNRTQYLDALVNMMGGNRPNATEPVASVATTPNGGQ